MQTTFVNQPMAFAKKHKTVFYYGEGEGVEAKRLADMERIGGNVGLPRDASAFDGQIENCNAVVILPNVRAHDRAKIEGAYGGDLIKVRGSDKWLGGEIRSLGSDKPAAVIIPEPLTVHGPKANPEEVSLRMAETNLRSNVAPARKPGRPRRIEQ
jgi:hypothetical protein